MDELQLTENLKNALGPQLKSIVSYGSRVADDHTKRFSKKNLLVVVETVSLATLKICAPLFKPWQKDGNPAPLFFSEQQVNDSHDVFPIEFLDIQANHQILYGMDSFAHLKIRHDHLRHQLEFELRSKLILLRQGYMTLNGNADRVGQMLAESLSGLTALLKALLRVVGASVPAKKHEVWAAVKPLVTCDMTVFEKILVLREGKKLSQTEIDTLFDNTLQVLECLVNFVNHVQK